MDKLVQLQAALRAIENGQRLESVDGMLVRQVLLQPRVQRDETQEPDAKKLYRELLAHRKAKTEQKPKLRDAVEINYSSKATLSRSSKKNSANSQSYAASVATQSDSLRSPERYTKIDAVEVAVDHLQVDTEQIAKSMKMALATRKRELKHSEKDVERAGHLLREEINRAEKILPAKFLFERNIENDRALEAARNVLIRFQHRFYKLYFRLWWDVTLSLRLQAQHRAVSELIRVYRGHRARLKARKLRRELRVLEDKKRQFLVFRIKYRVSQAIKLQMAWRRFLRKKAIKHRQARQTAATKLQRAFRTRQWRSQSLVNALANARKLFAAVGMQKIYRGHRIRRMIAESRRRQRQEERVQLALLRSMSKQARAQWMIARRGAGYLIAHRAIFPYAMRSKWRQILYQLRRHHAAKRIARAVCKWFGILERREAYRAKQIREWLDLVQRENERSSSAAVTIQKHLRRWMQQRQFLMAEARRMKLTRRARLAEKSRRLREMQHHKEPGWFNRDRKSAATSSAERKVSPSSSYTPGPKPVRLVSALKFVKDGPSQMTQRTDVLAARTLQCCYRRFRVRKRIQVRIWMKAAHTVEIRVIQRHEAATQIQRRVRGIIGRRKARQRRAERLLVHFILRWKWRRVRKRHLAARKLSRWFKHKRTQQRARRWRLERQRQLAATCWIQRWFRYRFVIQTRLKHLLKLARKRDETLAFCEQSLRLCRQHVADAFAVQSLHASLQDALRPLLSDGSTRLPSKSKGSPSKVKVIDASSDKHSPGAVAFPVLQMMFLVACGWKTPFVWHELDGKTLGQTKLERAKAVSFFRLLSKKGKPVGSGAAHSRQPANSITASLSPSRRGPKGSVKGTRGTAAADLFSSVEVDVAIARATGGAKGALDFATFVCVLERLGEITLAQQSPASNLMWGRYDGTEARVLALLWCSLFPQGTMQPLSLQFEAVITDALARHVTYLQRCFGRHRDKVKGAALLNEKRRNLRNQEFVRAAIILQKHARRLLGRRALRLRVQEMYEKFLDPTWGLPYWMNPRSGYSTWLKPRILGAEDVKGEPVPFPPPERTLKARCNGRENCERCAQWVCYDCDEFFCLDCIEKYHKAKAVPTSGAESGMKSIALLEEDVEKDDTDKREDKQTDAKRDHELERLLLCGLCQFQLASRRCLDCMPKLPIKAKFKVVPTPTKPSERRHQEKAKLTEGEEKDEGERSNSESLFCDVCFEFLHRRGGLKVHRTEPLMELCTMCNPDDESTAPSSEQPPLHRFGAGDAVQWECEVCGDPPRRVCGRCVLRSHPVESCGELHSVPLQTLGRRERAERLQEEQEVRDRADLDKMRARALRARQERCARKIQAFWRSHGPTLGARRIAEARRKEKSDQWLRYVEDKRIAKRIGFRAKDALGMAPSLSTDSPVQRRLRSLHALARRQLSIRARFFGLLVDEYVTVGIPLPGIGFLRPGSNELWTTEDQRGWVRNRQTLHLKKLTAEESQPRERPLAAWRQLERWEKSGGDPGADEPERHSTWFAEIHRKQSITEGIVPMALPYEAPVPTKQRRRGEEEPNEDVPVAMFLVEISLDPKRTVWINHSLAEQFWEWKRLKLLARRNRAEQQQRAKEYKKQEGEREAKRKAEEALLNADNATKELGEIQTLTPVDPAPSQENAESQWPTAETVNVENPDPYYNYYYPSNPAEEAAASSTGYEAYPTTPGAMTADPSGLVDSTSYYSNGDYAAEGNTSNWYGSEYSAYDMSGYNPAPSDNYALGSNDTPGAYPDYEASGNYTAATDNYYSYDQWGYVNDVQSTNAYSYQGDNDYNTSSNMTPAAIGADGTSYPDQAAYGAQSLWEEVFDPNTSQVYYVNRLTNETAWQIPS